MLCRVQIRTIIVELWRFGLMSERDIDVLIAGHACLDIIPSFSSKERLLPEKVFRPGGLVIVGGASVTTTLPHGSPDDVKKELKWLVDKGPETGLFLGGSSSITPGTPWENIKILIEGLKFYREKGRTG